MRKIGVSILILILATSLVLAINLGDYNTNAREAGNEIREQLQARNMSSNVTLGTELAQRIRAHLQDCEEKENRTERIECRLKIKQIATRKIVQAWKEQNKDETPEACRNLNTNRKEECRKLHRAINNCFEKEGREKDRCFKRVAGFINSNLNDERSNKSEKGRIYIVSLLEELQQKIEDKVESGRINDATGADLISQITDIKESVLNGDSREIIQPKIQKFKLDYRNTMVENQNNNSGNNQTEENNSIGGNTTQ
ncbi:hypothetical protein J4205_02030 [Candidatus Pacearchaeota archaeon]|nr:hypothetical protein [Candidatus Pacearchaeota archaeon]